MPPKRVVIVGAGPCGLVSLKEMMAAGHNAVLFERSPGLGGVFAGSAIYPNLNLTISNWAMAFSDFPDPRRLCYPSAEEYLQYLQSYARHFRLEQNINYNSEVWDAKVENDGRWSLKVHQHKRQMTIQVQADALIVSTGANQIPKEIPLGLNGFSGQVLHSAAYDEAFRREVQEKKLRVLVVGGGESGADISADLGELTPHAAVWLRRPVCVGPRYLVSDDEMGQVEANKTRDFPANGFLEAATTNRMSAAQNVYIYGLFRRILWNTPILNRTLARLCLQSTAPAFFMNDQATYVTKNQRMCESWGKGKLEVLVCPRVSAHDRSINLYHSNDKLQKREFDAIVLCTGYRTSFPWLMLDDVDANSRSWYLHCFPKNHGHHLFFVGYARPHQGGIPAMAEMLSRYIALVLSGERKLPANYAARALRDEAAEREYYHISPELTTLVDYNAFLESVARRVGCEPRLPVHCVIVFNLHMLAVSMLLLRYICPDLKVLGYRFAALLWVSTLALFFSIDNGLLIKWWFYPHWAVWYRQRGPGANPKLLENVLQRVNLWKSTAITKGFILLILWSWPAYYAQRLLSVLLFFPHVILNALGLRFSKEWGGLLRTKIFSLHDAQWRLSDLFLP